MDDSSALFCSTNPNHEAAFQKQLVGNYFYLYTMPNPLLDYQVKLLQSEERQTILHCCVAVDYAYRIWPSTFLIEHNTGKKVKLLAAFNISFAPEWTLNQSRGFTLIFEGLSKACELFDLIEIIPEEGGFEFKDILRNSNDVYTLRF